MKASNIKKVKINKKKKGFLLINSRLYITLSVLFNKKLIYIISIILFSPYMNLFNCNSRNHLMKSSEVTLKIEGPGENILILSDIFVGRNNQFEVYIDNVPQDDDKMKMIYFIILK